MARIPQRLDVLKRLTTLLNGVASESGDPYVFSVGDRVYRGIREYSGDADQWPLPMLSILESPRPDIGLYVGTEGSDRLEEWDLLLQGWVEDDKDNPSDPGYWLMAAVEDRLSRIIQTDNQGNPVYPNDFWLGHTITRITCGPGVVRPPEKGVSSRAFFYLPLRVGLATTAGEPYIPA